MSALPSDAPVTAANTSRRLLRSCVTPFLYVSASLAIAFAMASVLAFTTEPPLTALVWFCLGMSAIAAIESAFTVCSTVLVPLFADRHEPRELPALQEIVDVKSVLVFPILLLNETEIDRLAPVLRRHYLANRGGALYFGLLADFCDADRPTVESDQRLAAHAVELIAALNRTCAPADGPRFFLLLRPRKWAAAQRRWMGHERKRGALCDLVKFLRTGRAEDFSLLSGAARQIVDAEYLITLDDDNELQDGGALQLIQRMRRHRPVIDSVRGVVVSGYGVLQPAIASVACSDTSTRYERFQARGTNEGPRIESAYDILFGEGLFFGKGIICTKTFHRLLCDRFPDDRILSHDVLEGCYLRCGVVHDVVVKELSPRTLPIAIARLHRWIRGDCQTVRWALGSVPTPRDGAVKNPLSPLARWKLVEIFARGFGPIATFLLLVSAWFLPEIQLQIGITIAALRLSPYLVGALMSWRMPGSFAEMRRSLVERLTLVWADLCREVIFFSTLPCLAWNAVTAIVMALWRVHVVKRHQLEWRSTTRISLESKGSFGAHCLALRANLLCVLAAAVLLSVHAVGWTPILAACALLWSLGPLLSWWYAQRAGSSR